MGVIESELLTEWPIPKLRGLFAVSLIQTASLSRDNQMIGWIVYSQAELDKSLWFRGMDEFNSMK